MLQTSHPDNVALEEWVVVAEYGQHGAIHLWHVQVLHLQYVHQTQERNDVQGRQTVHGQLLHERLLKPLC